MPSTTVLTEEGPMTEPRYPTEGATQGPFSFGSSGFCINDTWRENGKFLKRILFPELLKSEKAKKSAQDDASMIVDRPWIQAQLQHYGIDFSPDIDPFKAKALLLTTVAHGLVSKSVSINPSRAASLTLYSAIRFRPEFSTSRPHSRKNTRP